VAVCTGQVRIRHADRVTLVSRTRSSSVRAGLAMRAKIVLAAADGEGTSAISRRQGVAPEGDPVTGARYTATGLSGLDDAARIVAFDLEECDANNSGSNGPIRAGL